MEAHLLASAAWRSLAAWITSVHWWHLRSSSLLSAPRVAMKRAISWSEGNWATCLTSHLAAFTWPRRKAAIRHDTRRLSMLSMSAWAATSSCTTSR
uniref:Secreted protein n=1 Tax=Ixodes ricinus TaxID=34613 RepID=A0A6B0U3Y1_IXORI